MGDQGLVNDPQLIAEAQLRQAFQRHLPRRVGALQRRLSALDEGGWDVNLLRACQLEVGALAGTAGRYDMIEASEQLATLEQVLARSTASGSIPDPEQAATIGAAVERLNAISGAESERPLIRSSEVNKPTTPAPEVELNGLPGSSNVLGLVRPPLEFLPFDEVPTPLHQMQSSAGDLTGSADRDIELLTESANTIEVGDIAGQIIADEDLFSMEMPDDPSKAWSEERKRLTGEQPAVLVSDEEVDRAHAALAEPEPEPEVDHKALYFLSDHRPVVLLDELERNYEVEFFDSMEDFIEVLNAVSPDALLVAGDQFANLSRLTPLVEKARRHKQGKPMPFFVLAGSSEIEQRLAALRAGADALLPADTDPAEIHRRLDELLQAGSEQPFRVLVLEDDTSQSMLTGRILRKAGMQVEVQPDPLLVMASLETFLPDLILMDLYMPGCDGMELTTIIREHPQFLHTPIVFLSGESDTDKHFDALHAGGDDFLAKPVRPKHLISAVTNRIRRSRALEARHRSSVSRQDPATGLYDRSYLMDRVNAALLAAPLEPDAIDGLLFIEIDDVTELKRQYGVDGLDSLSRQIGSILSTQVAANDNAATADAVVSRYADGVFALLIKQTSSRQLKQLGEAVIAQVAGAPLGVADDSVSCTVSIGICPLSNQFGDAGAIVAAAEQTAAEGAPVPSRLRLHEQLAVAERSIEHEAIEQSLRHAIKQNQLQVVYQPIVSLHGEESELYQSLARLPTADGGSLPASEFIGIAERSGLVANIDRQMIARAVAVLDRRHRSGRQTQLFVNQSPAFKRDKNRLEWLQQLLKLRDVDPRFLVLEFQLGALAKDERSTSTIKALRKIGIGLCLAGLDGSATHEYLIKELEPDFVKLMQLSQIASGVDIKGVVKRLHALNLNVIMPTVEDARTAASLWSYEVDFIQGNFVQPPDATLTYQFAAGG